MKMNQAGPTLGTKSVEKGEVVEIMNEGEYRENTKYTYEDGTPKKDCIFKVKYQGEEKEMRFNKSTQVNLIEAFGDETKEWIGKKAKIMILPTPKGDNKMIVLDPITKEEPAEISWDE